LPIFDDLVPHRDVWPLRAHWPLRRAQALLLRFQTEFPCLHYELFWDTRLLNAQAYIGPKGRCVRLFGGLARHKQLGVEGLAFAIAHETGHHLGGQPRHPLYLSLSSEERANEWAIDVGLPTVFNKPISLRYRSNGLAQLRSVWVRYSRADSIIPFHSVTAE
jgi:hypothetical protein